MFWRTFDRRKHELPTPVEAMAGRAQALAVSKHHYVTKANTLPPFPVGSRIAVFGMGCFWSEPGIITTNVGYAGGLTPNPTYGEVCSGRTGHAEVVRVIYDSAQINYDQLLKTFWEGHDPTAGMRQGNDVGTQYRSAIYVDGPDQLAAATASRDAYGDRLRSAGFGRITTEIASDVPFYYAEDYHQQYLAKHPDGYCGLGDTGVSCLVGLG